MPNLQHDPKNPSDLLGQSLSEGDIVAWGTTCGKSAAIAVCVLKKIRFTDNPGYGKRREVPQHRAEDYTLSVVPLKSTGYVDDYTFEYDPVTKTGRRVPHPPKAKSVKLVKNVVKLNMTREEVEALIQNG